MNTDVLIMHAITTLAGFAAVLTVQIFAWKREERRHRWQKEENRQMRAEVSDLKSEVKNGNGHTLKHG